MLCVIVRKNFVLKDLYDGGTDSPNLLVAEVRLLDAHAVPWERGVGEAREGRRGEQREVAQGREQPLVVRAKCRLVFAHDA